MAFKHWDECVLVPRKCRSHPMRGQKSPRHTKTRQAASLLAFDLHRLHRYFFVGAVLAVARRLCDLFNHVVALDHLAEDGGLAGEPFRVAYRNEELGTIGVGAGLGHGELSGLVEPMRRTFGFVFELVAGAAHAGAHRVSALDHKVGYYAVEDGSV